MIGTHSVFVYADRDNPAGAGASADVSCLIDQVAVTHGRDGDDGQPNASAATIDLTATPTAPLPALVDIGAVVIVRTTINGNTFTRFSGRITDITLAWDDAGDETPFSGVGQLVAVSFLADLGRRLVGAGAFPQELDGARAARVASEAGYPLNPATSDPGTVQILPRDADEKEALGIIHETAQSASGILWQTRAGEIRYADAEHRRGMLASLTLDACDVLVTPQWVRNLDGLVNVVSIGYGVAPEGGGEPRYNATNATSLGRYGRYEASISTELAALADAQAMGQLITTRNAYPAWNMSALPVDLKGFTDAETETLLGLDMHNLVTLTGMPAIGTAPTNTSLWLEGWRETLSHGAHELELYVSGYCRTSPPPRWDDIAPALTWDQAPGIWDEAYCLGPLPPLDTWQGVPASVRWDSVAPAVTWDTYKPGTMGE